MEYLEYLSKNFKKFRIRSKSIKSFKKFAKLLKSQNKFFFPILEKRDDWALRKRLFGQKMCPSNWSSSWINLFLFFCLILFIFFSVSCSIHILNMKYSTPVLQWSRYSCPMSIAGLITLLDRRSVSTKKLLLRIHFKFNLSKKKKERLRNEN